MMDMDLTDLITDPELGGTVFAYWRSREWVDGKGRSRTEATRHVAQGNIQPAPGKERELLEEGERQKAAILIFTTDQLCAGEGAVKADRVRYRGGTYRVALAEPWLEHGGFCKAVAVYEGEAEPATTEPEDTP